MTPSERIQEMILRLQEMEDGGRELLIAAGSAVGEMGIRIFERGENSSGATFSYSTKGPIWVSDLAVPQGKKNTGKTGRAQKTSVYDSYKAMRSQQGRSDDPVNWRFTGELKSDFFNTPNADNNTPQLEFKSGVVEVRLKNDENIKKRVGIDRKYKNVFSISEQEKKLFRDTLRFEIKKTLSR